MHELWRVLTDYPLSPLTFVALMAAAAVICHARRRPAWAVAWAGAGLISLWLASTPALAQALENALVSRQASPSIEATPRADAILLLGGALRSPRPPDFRFRPTSAVDRVWHAANLYRAGKAPFILVSAGPEPPQGGHPAEAHAIADLLVARGVPRSAIRLETRSKNTRENATYSLELIQKTGARRILLVTSPRHMARALETFRKSWPPGAPEVVAAGARPSPTDGQPNWKPWLPTASALLDVTRCLKEFAGIIALAMI